MLLMIHIVHKDLDFQGKIYINSALWYLSRDFSTWFDTDSDPVQLQISFSAWMKLNKMAVFLDTTQCYVECIESEEKREKKHTES